MILLGILLALTSSEIIENQLIIKDARGAEATADYALQNEPHTPELLGKAIKAYARAGNEEAMLKAYYEWQGEETERRLLQEEMAWSIIHKGAKGSKPLIRLMSALAAHLSKDARGILLLCDLINDSNALVRGMVAEVAAGTLDEPFRNALLKRLNEEQEWDVRLALIRDLGTMRIEKAKPYLESLISQEGISMEEKGAAIEALVYLYEGAPRAEVVRLSQSNRAALRQLAATVVTFFQEKESEDILLLLSRDPHPDVRSASWFGLAILKSDVPYSALNDPEFSVQLASAYHHLNTNSRSIEDWFFKTLNSGTKEEKRKLSGLTRVTGERGKELAKQFRSVSNDSFVQLNFARALLDDQALETLYKSISDRKTLWMEEEVGNIPYLTESKINHRPAIPNYPEVVDRDIRLQLINILAIKEYPYAQDALRTYLKDPNWGITAMSLALLLSEGDDNAVDIARALLNDPDPNVQLQAALILARWDPQEKVLETLESRYDKLPMEKKEVIIQAIGELDDPKSIDFLIKELGAAHQSIRIIAAAAILNTLYD